jgi:hypothetical protein
MTDDVEYALRRISENILAHSNLIKNTREVVLIVIQKYPELEDKFPELFVEALRFCFPFVDKKTIRARETLH